MNATTRIKIVGCQPIECIGDTIKNQSSILKLSRDADIMGASLICFPECFLQGYVVHPQKSQKLAISLDSNEFGSVLSKLHSIRATLVFGLIELSEGALYNTAVAVRSGVLLGAYRKTHLLPGERAVFSAGTKFPIFDLERIKFGINICYDTNFRDCATSVASQGARLLVCPANNMMKHATAVKWKKKHNAIRAQRCRESKLWLLSSDVTGERDGRVSYGPTAVIDPLGQVVAQAALGTPGMVVFDILIDGGRS